MIRKAACAGADALARAGGSLWAIYGSIVYCIGAWIISPPKPSDVSMTLVTYVGFVLLFVIQRSGNLDTKAIKSGTAEVVRALPEADESKMASE